MKRTILASLTILTLAVAAAAPASAINTRFRQAHRMHNDVAGGGGKAFTPALTTETNLTQRFKEARQQNLDKLNPKFKEARRINLESGR